MVVLCQKKRDRAQINKITNEKGETASESFAEIQRIIRDYYKQLYASKTGRNEQILGKVQFSKIEPGRIRKY